MFNLNKQFSISLLIFSTISSTISKAHAQDLSTPSEDNQTNEETKEDTKDGSNDETSSIEDNTNKKLEETSTTKDTSSDLNETLPNSNADEGTPTSPLAPFFKDAGSTEGDIEASEENPEESTTSKIEFNPESAESLDTTLTKKQIKWLEPTRGKLPQNPYQHVDFTAYTLEWGELQAGLNRSTIGILPRTQIGTQIPLWALGIQNANAKVNVLRLGPVDLAITGNYLNLAPTADQSLNIQYYGVGGYGSFRILDNWSIHAGAQYAELNLSGLPNLDALSGPIRTFSGLTDEDIQNVTSAIEEAVTYERSEQILSAKIATDIRLNRRDSFILQGNMMRSETDNSGLSVEAEGVGLSLESEQISSPLFQYLLVPQDSSTNYGASIAYQASFKRAYLRLGVGYSTIPYSWLLQSIDLTWRWGGATKRRANKLEKVWELNKKLNNQGGDQR